MFKQGNNQLFSTLNFSAQPKMMEIDDEVYLRNLIDDFDKQKIEIISLRREVERLKREVQSLNDKFKQTNMINKK
jgi:polyhydroxyalkanoate synthesis regulator phasin